MTTVTIPSLTELTDDQLREAWCADGADLDALAAECDRRDSAEVERKARSDRARAAASVRRGEWEAAAYAQYEQAEAYCRGNMLSDAGKARGRDAWPMVWEGAEDTARKLASDELITFWDYVSPRVPGPGAYAASKRAAAADHAERSAEITPEPPRAPQPARPVPALEWQAVTGGRVAQTVITASGQWWPAWFAETPAGERSLHRTRDAAAGSLAPEPPPAPEPRPVVPPMRPGSIARYAARLRQMRAEIDQTTIAQMRLNAQIRGTK